MASLRKRAIGGIGAVAIAAAFLVPFEGTKYKAYRDIGGVWTICNGHTANVHEGDTATEAECALYRLQDVKMASDAYDRLVYREHPDNVKAACIDFIYNLGAGNFAKSTIRKKLNRGDRAGACNHILDWKFAAGKDCSIKLNKCSGIMTRRIKERELCNDPNTYISFTFGPDYIIHGVRAPSH